MTASSRIGLPGLCVLLAVLTTPLWGEDIDECVVVLHGLGRTANSMDEIEEKLLGAGYRVWNEGYPSRRENITSLAAIYVGSGARYCADASRMHFVTHSLGGILVRQYLQQVQLENLGRIVMLAPPNRGSKVTDRLRDSGWYRSLIGPAGQQLVLRILPDPTIQHLLFIRTYGPPDLLYNQIRYMK